MLYGFCPFEENTITKLINLIDNTLLKFPPEVTVSNHIKYSTKSYIETNMDVLGVNARTQQL